MNTERITERVSRIIVNLPNSPLRTLNSYIIRGDERNLLVDTGFNNPESFANLEEGIRDIGIDMRSTDIFLTHCHADHAGNAGHIASKESIIYAGDLEKYEIEVTIGDNIRLRQFFAERMLKMGFPEEEKEEYLSSNPAVRHNENNKFEIVPIGEDHIFDLGGIRVRAFYTPGHTPGHMCLSIDEEKILFTGDHVLFDISPNIVEWPGFHNSLDSYIKMLRKVGSMDVLLALPGHRECGDLKERVAFLIDHHEKRLSEVLEIVKRRPAQTCYDVASFMKWKIKESEWTSFPKSQKYFAVGEACSHLRYLEVQGKIKSNDNGVERFTANYCSDN